MKRKTLRDILSLNLMMRSLQSMEQGTMWVIGLSWLAAFFMVALAVYTIYLSVEAHKDTISILAAEPQLPQIQSQVIDLSKDAALLERLQKNYPDIHFASQNANLVVTSNNGDQFREWLAALDYVDALVPEWQWSLHEFCVGQCPGHDLMYAVLSAENIVFSMP